MKNGVLRCLASSHFIKQLDMKTIILIMAIFTFGVAFNQKKTETIKIQTSAECGMCKEAIEEALNYTKGVKFAELTVKTRIVEVKFRTDKITKEEIIAVINKAGYDADGSPADKKAYAALPACCKKNGKCEGEK